jgi:hypothetical protein
VNGVPLATGLAGERDVLVADVFDVEDHADSSIDGDTRRRGG